MAFVEIQKITVLDIARIVREVERLRGSTITAILGDLPSDVVFIRLFGPELILKFVAGKKYAYLASVDSVPSAAKEVFRTARGCKITGCRQLNFDRIIRIDLEKKDRLGRIVSFALIFEIMPGRGNAYVVDERGIIRESFKKRKIREYALPPPLKKESILNLNFGRIKGIIGGGRPIEDEIYGLSKRDVENVLYRLDQKQGEFKDIIEKYVEDATLPGPAWVIRRGGLPAGFSLVKPILAHDETAEIYDTALRLYERYYTEISSAQETGQRLERLIGVLDSAVRKNEKKLTAIDKEMGEARNAELYKAYGESILAGQESIKRGMKSVRLKNMESDQPEYYDIELDPSKSASANAAAYFRKYKKAIASRTSLKKRRAETEKFLKILEEGKSLRGNDPESLSNFLLEMGLISKVSGRKARRVQPERKPYRQFRASCGWEILVGKSNADNDELTFKIASRDDFWFHAWQAAGSHTILRLPDKKSVPDKKTLTEAASLAAYFSKARGSSKVPVIYTQAKYVRKPRKFPPGRVMVEREKQIMVKPGDPARFQG